MHILMDLLMSEEYSEESSKIFGSKLKANKRKSTLLAMAMLSVEGVQDRWDFC